MNYLWEIMLQAGAQRIEKEKIHFTAARKYSPYMELAEEFMNRNSLEEPYRVEINPYYRFDRIFRCMFHPDLKDYPSLREGLFQLLMHLLAENDLKMGMTREEYYKKLLGRAIADGIYGKEAAQAFVLFKENQREILLQGMLTLYREGESIALFRQVICELISNSIVYNSNKAPYEILVYIGKKKSESLKQKVAFIINQFAGIRYHVDIYYEYHFGIIDIEETMCIGEIAIC